MNRHLPPLNALKAFEAAARHLSVKMAADELCVTPGAVSQMLKSLETHLGVKLFERVTRGIYLTDAGRDYLPAVRNAFRQIAEASRRVMASNDSGMLTVSVTPFFASAWLLPRMHSFQEISPEIDLQIVASSTLADFSRGSVDVAVRHGDGRYPGLRSDRVVTVEMVAVAALISSIASASLDARTISSAGRMSMMPTARDGAFGSRQMAWKSSVLPAVRRLTIAALF